jgi:hypothetical protein
MFSRTHLTAIHRLPSWPRVMTTSQSCWMRPCWTSSATGPDGGKVLRIAVKTPPRTRPHGCGSRPDVELGSHAIPCDSSKFGPSRRRFEEPDPHAKRI